MLTTPSYFSPQYRQVHALANPDTGEMIDIGIARYRYLGYIG